MVVADSSFAALELLEAVRRSVTVITRLRLDAALYEPAPPRQPRQNGRPRLKGARLPTLDAVLGSAATRWTKQLVAGWYGGTARVVEVTSATALWYHTGKPAVPVRRVVVRDPSDAFKPQALLSTNLESDPVETLEYFVRRWSVEVIFEEARAHLGVETQRQWSEKAVARTTPAVLALFSVVTLLAHQQHGQKKEQARRGKRIGPVEEFKEANPELTFIIDGVEQEKRKPRSKEKRKSDYSKRKSRHTRKRESPNNERGSGNGSLRWKLPGCHEISAPMLPTAGGKFMGQVKK